MRRYLFLLAYEPGGWESASEAERQAFVDDHAAFEAYVAEHGARVASAALDDTDQATTVRRAGGRSDGEVLLTDGPFAETAEMIGGYYEVDLPDLDAAIAAALLLPASYSVEIRPTIRIGADGPE